MKPSLQLRQTQQLALTPQLQQSIRLLQLSTLELNQELEQALADNPMLERLDDPLDGCVRVAASGSLDDHSTRTPAADSAQRSDDAGETDADSWNADEWGDSTDDDRTAGWSTERGRTTDGDDDRDYPQLAATAVSLREHLGEQLAATRCTPRDRALVQLLIDALDDDGLLESTADEVAAMLPAEIGVSSEELGTALRLLQSFDPAGVGASDLRECLLLQLDRRTAGDAVMRNRHEAERWRLARAIVDHHLEVLAAKDFPRLRRALRCNDEALRAAHALILQLDPRPGAAFATAQATFVVPDVIARRANDGWTATLNPAVMPRVRVNDTYAQILKRNRGAAGGLPGQLQEARWLIRNLQQRFETILRVAQAIVKRQHAFFSHGAVAMRPLVLRDIAETLGLHESTVSRVTSHKYILTPFGTYELKYFFGSHVATDSGGAASSIAIRALIRQLIEAEDSSRPLSDGRISELLAEQGFIVARRTVAKYRESMRIPTVSKRKSL